MEKKFFAIKILQLIFLICAESLFIDLLTKHKLGL